MQLFNLIQHIAQRQGWTAQMDQQGTIQVSIALHGNRYQVVRVTEGKDPDQDDIIYLASTAGEQAACRDPWGLLTYSVNMAYGSAVLHQGHIVVKHTIRKAAADDATLTKSIFHVGREADTLEAQAYGQHTDRM